MNRFWPARISCLVAIVAQLAGAQNTSRISKPIEFWNPDWSPDGRSIVFESTPSGKSSIYTIKADGSALTRLTMDTASSYQPRWSPDGRRIVYTSDRDGAGNIHTLNADGTNAVRLTAMPAKGGWYQSSFSPDGQWIAFQGRPDNRETRERVFVMRVDGSGLRLLSDSTAYSAEGPRWSADSKSVEFRRVPYPARFWEEMGPAQMKVARDGEALVAISLAGGAERVLPRKAPPTQPNPVIPADAEPSPDRKTLAYSRSADGWAGLYVYDLVAKKEKLLVGGPGAGPLGYLRTATLTRWNDTLDTYDSPRTGGTITRGNGAYVIRELRQVAGGRWEFSDTWFDSTSKETAKQSVRTAPRSLVTELEFTRATTDSASMSYTKDRSTGWVVSAGKSPQLFDGPATGERYAGALVVAAIAMKKPENGAVFLAPGGALYGGNPLATRIDSMTVVRRDTLFSGRTPLPLVVIRRGTSEFWVDESTGAEILARGNAGPQRYWWHIRRGVRPPTVSGP